MRSFNIASEEERSRRKRPHNWDNLELRKKGKKKNEKNHAFRSTSFVFFSFIRSERSACFVHSFRVLRSFLLIHIL